MCGIGAVISYSPTEEKAAEIKKLGLEVLERLSVRGTDAAGVYWERGKERRLLKGGFPAADFIKALESDEKWRDYRLTGLERVILLHARAATQGAVSDNHNNHPLISKHWVLVHNGVLRNVRVSGYGYKGQVDSEEILALIESKGIQKGLAAVEGSAAIIFKQRAADKLYMWRNANPLVACYVPALDVLVLASTAASIPMASSIGWESAVWGAEAGGVVRDVPIDVLWSISLLHRKIKNGGRVTSSSSVTCGRYAYGKYGTAWDRRGYDD